MSLGLGSNLSKGGIVTPGIVTDNLVLKHSYNAGAVVPISDGAAYFGPNGEDDHIECGTTGLNPNSITIGAWVHHGGTQQSNNFPRIIEGDGDEMSWHLRYDKSGSRFVSRFSANGSDNELCQSDSSYTDYSKWYYLATTYDASTGTCKMYVDGVHDGTDTGAITGSLHTPSTPGVRIGQESDGTGNNWEGYICNVGVWSQVLTQAQIKSIMWKNYANLSTSEKTNLVSWWNLDGVGYNSDSNNNIARDYVGTIGSELVVNGTFDTDSGWTKTGATIGSGTTLISEDSAYNRIQQTHSNTTTTGNFYRLTYDVLSNTFSNASTGLNLGGAGSRYVSSNKTIPSTVGSHIYDFKSDNNGGELVIQINNNTGTGSIKIDNISLKQLSGNNGTLV